jgi:hypothetical protein
VLTLNHRSSATELTWKLQYNVNSIPLVEYILTYSLGGIFEITRGGSDTYPSELGPSGQVSWTTSQTEGNKVSVEYPYWEESFLQDPYGWSILMWQGWAVGDFPVSSSGTYLLQCENTKQVYIDSIDTELAGDWFGYGYLYNTVQLEEGKVICRICTDQNI